MELPLASGRNARRALDPNPGSYISVGYQTYLIFIFLEAIDYCIMSKYLLKT